MQTCLFPLLFSIFVDRRDSLKRATNISLVDVAEPIDGESRELVMAINYLSFWMYQNQPFNSYE